MDDLKALNRRIAEYWLGRLDANQEDYLSYLSVCLGQFTHSAAKLNKILAVLKQEETDLLRFARLNRRYLNFARVAAKDVPARRPEVLVKLGITLEQAEVLEQLTEREVDRLAFALDGPIVGFAIQAFSRGTALRARAAKHHATAFVATRSHNKSN
jgi:hypothetical protein